MIKIIYLCGLQAAGKSTWAKEFCQANLDYKRLNKDSIRKMLGFQWDKRIENDVHRIHSDLFEMYIKNGWNVVVDNTGFHRSQLKDLLKIASKYYQNDIQFEIKYFPVELEEAIRRDSLREDSVGEDVIRDYWKRFGKNADNIIKQLKSDIDEFNSSSKKFEQYIPNNDLPRAIIVDVDGTLAHMHNRGPFDYDKVVDDIVDEQVKELCNKYYDEGYHVIIVTGRENVGHKDGNVVSVKEKTIYWLKRHEISFDEVFIRDEGDMRPDNIIKYEIFNKYIRNNYNVQFCVDDRPQVIRMYRELGLKVFQVNDREF